VANVWHETYSRFVQAYISQFECLVHMLRYKNEIDFAT